MSFVFRLTYNHDLNGQEMTSALRDSFNQLTQLENIRHVIVVHIDVTI